MYSSLDGVPERSPCSDIPIELFQSEFGEFYLGSGSREAVATTGTGVAGTVRARSIFTMAAYKPSLNSSELAISSATSFSGILLRYSSSRRSNSSSFLFRLSLS